MSDYLLDLGQNPTARKVVKTLGLPIPIPQALNRARGPWEARPLQGRDVLVGAAPGAADLEPHSRTQRANRVPPAEACGHSAASRSRCRLARPRCAAWIRVAEAWRVTCPSTAPAAPCRSSKCKSPAARRSGGGLRRMTQRTAARSR